MTYNEMRAEAIATREREVKRTGFRYCGTTTAFRVSGISFAMYVLRQSYNSADAVQVLHYVDGKKVNKATFINQLAQVS